jgi:hypothetical protein
VPNEYSKFTLVIPNISKESIAKEIKKVSVKKYKR